MPEPRDWATWTGCAPVGARPNRGFQPSVAMWPLSRGVRARGCGSPSRCPTGPRGARSQAGPLSIHRCVKPSSSPRCGFPTGHVCPVDWSVGRRSFLCCEVARGRRPNNVQGQRPCAARCPNRGGWSPNPPSNPRACCTSRTIAMATHQIGEDRGCCRPRPRWPCILANSFQSAHSRTNLRAKRRGRRPGQGNVEVPRGCRCASSSLQRWRGAPEGWGRPPHAFCKSGGNCTQAFA